MISKTDLIDFVDLPEIHVKSMQLTRIEWVDWQGFAHRQTHKVILDNGQTFLLGQVEIDYLLYLKQGTDLKRTVSMIWWAFGTTARTMKRLEALQKKGLVRILMDYGPRHGKGVALTPLGYMVSRAIQEYREANKQ